MRIRKLILGILLLGPTMCAQTPKPFIRTTWGNEFKLLRSDNGDTISIGSFFPGKDNLHVYDMAGGQIVSYDLHGKLVQRISLTSFGRMTYAGDDFVIRRKEIIFLNTVDKRLEIYDKETGKHIKSLYYPLNIFKNEPKRTRRVINRIFLDKDRIVLGNAYHFFYLDEGLGKKAKGTSINSAESGHRFLYMDNERIVSQKDTSIFENEKPRGKIVTSHFPVAGKKYAHFNDKLYALVLTRKEMKIVEIQ